ncbi:MAG: hypothetical protein FJX46_01890 [Alphaproteobacteria bacterium]|nr:hypothetical protein [Alphaproteobacteria bacterium]
MSDRIVLIVARILSYVEDTGAANFLAPLSGALQGLGHDVIMTAAESGARQLAELGVGFHRPDGDLLTQYRPDAVVVGTAKNPDTLGLTLIDRARTRSITSFGAVDGANAMELRFAGRSNDPLAHRPDYLLVPDAAIAAGYVALGMPEARVVVCGHPHVDRASRRREELAMEGRPAVRRRVLPDAGGRRVMVFLGEASHGLDAGRFERQPGYSLHGRGGSDLRTHIVIEEFLDASAALDPRPYRVLRLHPRDDLEEYRPYLAEFDTVSRGGDPLELMYAADLVVGLTTILMVESTVLGTPTLAVLPRMLERHWITAIAAGVIPCATDRAGLIAALREPPIPNEKSDRFLLRDSAVHMAAAISERIESKAI